MTHVQIDEFHWLTEIVKEGNHFWISGNPDSGRLALAVKLVEEFKETCPDLGLTLLDRDFLSVDLKRSGGLDECLVNMMKNFGELIDRRSEQIEAEQTHVFIIDGIDLLLITAKEQNPEIEPMFRQLLLKGLTVAQKDIGIKVIYISKEASRYSWRKSDFNVFNALEDSVRIFTEGEILTALHYGLGDAVTEEEQDSCLEQYRSRIEQGEKSSCLVKAPGLPPFIAATPEPGHGGILN